MEYTTKNGDTVEARGLILKGELGEKTRNEIVSQVVDRMQDATETIERLTQALAEADAENARLRKLADAVGDFVGDVNCDGCPLRSHCDDNNRMACGGELSYHAFDAMRLLGIEAND